MTKHVLTTIVLCLSLSTYTAAQGNTDGFKEWTSRPTLEGLGEIGLIVKYGQVDGLEASTQPAVLQMLRDRAKDLLTKGQVSLLESTDEADMAGRPRLVLTVTVKKHSETVLPLHVESKLFQRVRLWRDPSQELELATWKWGNEDSRADYDKLTSLFDLQVNAFVKEYQAANPKLLRVENRTSEPPAQLKSNGNALQGLSGIDFIVSLGFFGEVDQRLNLLSGPLRTETENKFKQAGIRLLRRADSASAGYPLLNIRIMLNPNGHSYAHATEVRTEFMQRASALRGSKQNTYITTWETLTVDDTNITEEVVRRILNSHLDQFIEAYKSANPKAK